MALTKFGRETHKTTTQKRFSKCHPRLEHLISFHFCDKDIYTRDEDDGEEDAFVG